MSIQPIRNGYLIAQDQPEYTEHSIVIQRYEGCISIMQDGSDVVLSDAHVKEFIKALTNCAKEQP